MLTQLALTAVLAALTSAQSYDSQAGVTTRYWDCCKPSCSWSGKAGVTGCVKSCDVNNQPLSDTAAQSGCQGGTAYTCADQSPWAIDDNLAYGFAAVNFASGQSDSCCACYELTFTSGPVSGKKMVVQATNTGSDVAGNQFDLAIPGGGVGLFDACTTQYNAPAGGWGAQYGGIADSSSCASFAPAIKPGCMFRFDWFMGADNPSMTFKRVQCPAAIIAKSGCSRTDDSTAPPADTGSGGNGTAAATSAALPAQGTSTVAGVAQPSGQSVSTKKAEPTHPATNGTYHVPKPKPKKFSTVVVPKPKSSSTSVPPPSSYMTSTTATTPGAASSSAQPTSDATQPASASTTQTTAAAATTTESAADQTFYKEVLVAVASRLGIPLPSDLASL